MTTIPSPVVTINTAKSRKGLGSILLRPNAEVTLKTYQFILWIEVLGIIGLWLLMPNIIPSPVKVYDALLDLITDQGLLGELWTSLTLNMEALAWSTTISLALSYGAALPIMKPIALAISKGRFLSLAGMTFVVTMAVGGGHPLKLALLTIGLTVFFVTAMVDVVLQVPQSSLDYVRSLRANEWEVLWQSRVLGTLGAAFDIMRQNAAMGWLMLTMVEGLVRSEGGIGRLLIDQQKHFSLAAIFAVQFVFLMVGIGQDALLAWLKTIFVPYAALTTAKDKK
jgi:NitT/TauT family transport system permease protein